jgi:hypothetical protein
MNLPHITANKKEITTVFKRLKNKYLIKKGSFYNIPDFVSYLDENTEYTQRFFCELLDVSSSGYISNVKSGKKTLYHKSALILAELCQMSEKQKYFFYEAILKQKL